MADTKNKNISNKQKASIAYDLYMNTDKSQKEICEIVGWAPKTFTSHKQAGSWEELKSAVQLTPDRIILNIYSRMHDLSMEGKNLDADKLVKLASSIEKLKDKRVTMSSTINVFKDFTTWCYEKHPELAKDINELQRAYVDHKISAHG